MPLAFDRGKSSCQILGCAIQRKGSEEKRLFGVRLKKFAPFDEIDSDEIAKSKRHPGRLV